MLELWPELSMLATMLALFGQIQIWHHFSVQNLDILFNTLHINSLLMLLSQFAFFFRIQNLKDFTNPQNLDLIERNPIDRIEVALKSFLLIFAAGNKQSRPHFNDISIKRFASRTSNKYTMPWYAQCSLIAYFNAEKLANILCATATCRFDSIWFDGGLCVCARLFDCVAISVLGFVYSRQWFEVFGCACLFHIPIYLLKGNMTKIMYAHNELLGLLKSWIARQFPQTTIDSHAHTNRQWRITFADLVWSMFFVWHLFEMRCDSLCFA